MQIIPKYKLFRVRHYKKNFDASQKIWIWTHFDTFNRYKLFNLEDFENKDVYFEIYTNLTKRVMVTFDRITWKNQILNFQRKGEPFTIRFYRPMNIVDSCIALQNGFNEIWKSL